MKKNKTIIGLIACDPQGVIGKNGTLPWFYPEELSHFRALTLNQVMIMGYRTFEAMPKETLQNRLSIVFSKNHQKTSNKSDAIQFVSSIEEFLAILLPVDKKIYMIGGGEIAKLFLNAGLIDEFILTIIHKSYDGDTFFPLDLLKNWSRSILREEEDFTIYHYNSPPK